MMRETHNRRHAARRVWPSRPAGRAHLAREGSHADYAAEDPGLPQSIFRDLDLNQQTAFAYELEYSCRGHEIAIDAMNDKGKVAMTVAGELLPKERVRVSVDRLKLDEHVPLSDARRAIWQEVTKEIEGYYWAKQRSARGGNPAAREKLKAHITKLRKKLEPEAPLSSVAKWWVSFRNDPQLNLLIA